MESEVQLEPQAAQQKQSLLSTHRKAVIIGAVCVVILLIILILSLFFVQTKTRIAPIQPTTGAQNNTVQPQVLVVSDVSNITVTKVNNKALTQVFTDAHTVFSPNVQSIIVHLTDIPLTDPSKYMQHFIDATQKIQGGFYETTNPSAMTEDIYIYKDKQDFATAPSSFVSDEYWLYTLDAIWYLAHKKDYTSTDTNQLKNAATAEYQFTQTHLNSAFTLKVKL